MGLLEKIAFLFDKGGFAFYLISFSALTLIFISIERLNFLYLKYYFNSKEALNKIRQCILKRDYTSAIQICNSNLNAPDLQVVKVGLLAMEHGREAIKSALGGAVLEVSKKVEKRVPIVALIAAVSTLLGLLGTISGLIKTFDAIAGAAATDKARLLGEGISEAMYATASGLGVGIVAMVIHTLCTSKGDEIVGNAQSVGYQLMTWIEESERNK